VIVEQGVARTRPRPFPVLRCGGGPRGSLRLRWKNVSRNGVPHDLQIRGIQRYNTATLRADRAVALPVLGEDNKVIAAMHFWRKAGGHAVGVRVKNLETTNALWMN